MTNKKLLECLKTKNVTTKKENRKLPAKAAWNEIMPTWIVGEWRTKGSDNETKKKMEQEITLVFLRNYLNNGMSFFFLGMFPIYSYAYEGMVCSAEI